MKQSAVLLLLCSSLKTCASFKSSLELRMMGPVVRTYTNKQSHPVSFISSRRGFLSTATTPTFLSVFTFQPQKAEAVAPLTDKEADSGIGGGIARKVRPPLKDKVPRQDLALDFAVMLTRSSYIETAQLEIVPVNQLERDLYLVRTAEYQPYFQAAVSGGAPVRQGDLTDPYYFDFMSGVQYMTINRAMKDPQKDFDQEEPIQNEDGTQSTRFNTISIKRTMPDDLLIPTFDERVGNTILSFIKDRYKDSGIGLSSFDTAKPGSAAMLETYSQLINLFIINGFAWEGKASLVSEKVADGSMSFSLTLQNPATLWSRQLVAKAPVRNDFLRKTAVQLAKSMGYSIVSSSSQLKGNTEITQLVLK